MRIAILGNSGSGKSTLARRLAGADGITVLELDAIVWEPGKVAVPRKPEDVQADLERFIAENESWIIEGCYGDLLARALPFCTEFIFLNPGEATCLANNRKRPWEPHKYDSAEAQNAMLDYLLAWVKDYYIRDDQCSLANHRRLFDSYAGKKREMQGSVSDADP
jgi:adenylate kinase family enzyme